MRDRELVIASAAAAVVLIAAGIFIVYPLMVSPYSRSETGNISAGTTGTTPEITVSGTTTPSDILPKISLKQVTALVREDYSEYQYSIAGISLTGQYAGKPLYVVELIPVGDSVAERNETIFIDATTGDYYNPAQENAEISIEQAKDLARASFPQLSPDRVKMKFSDGSQYARGWEFSLINGDNQLVQGGLNADTGDLSWYAFGIVRKDRPENPSITLDAAQHIAEKEIQKHNGDLPITMTEARLDPLGMPGEKIAGKYVFVFKRIIRDIPCDSDGLTLTVDSVAGSVVEYRKSWSLPENAVASSASPAITKEVAIKTVQQEATRIYLASVAGLRIRSANLVWKDFHNPDKVTPAPGSIPLAWKVQFDDEILRAQQWPGTATGWVDAQTGSLVEMYYRH
ncbi:MAG: Peptidase propeptide and YPEB domain protein [Methanoregula sp. PtaU1.Bin051]|nr:MAG: Peptidase propeptide and YPEB domain protein [Methanoregula sp. PtaU1.Bin051]